MRHLLNPTQIELRAWSNGLQTLGPDVYQELETSTTLAACIRRVITSPTRHDRTVTTRLPRTAMPPTRRGGSSTGGRETNQQAQADHETQAAVRRPAPTDRSGDPGETRPATGFLSVSSLRSVLAVKTVTGASARVKVETSQPTVTANPSTSAQGRPPAGRPLPGRPTPLLGNTGFLCKPDSNRTSKASA